MRKKAAVIGKGTSAIIQACSFIEFGHDVEIFYDPDIPPVSVGESTTPHFPHLLTFALGLKMEDMIENALISRKRGVTFINWGNGTPWIHGFGGDPPDANNGIGSFHFDTVVLNKFLNEKLEEVGVKYRAEKVITLEERGSKVYVNSKEYDLVVNCTGWNYDPDLLITPQFHTVNAAFLYRDNDFMVTDELESKDLTVHLATEDGWEFNLPFPKENIVRKGYLFNTNYISENDVVKKLGEQGKKGKVFKWTPKKSKYLLESKRIAANGSRLFFNEPLQAYSVLMYSEMATMISKYLHFGPNQLEMNKVNLAYREAIIGYEQELAFHYQYGSVFKDSEFWNDKTKKAKEVMYYHPSASIEALDLLINSTDDEKILQNRKSIPRIFQHSRQDLLYVHRWMTDQWTENNKPKIRWSNQPLIT